MTPTRGDVWLVDLGMAAEIRPCLALSVPAVAEDDRALATLAPHTTSVRGLRFEVPTHERFLKAGAFDAQNLITVPTAKLIRRLGILPTTRLNELEPAVKRWLGFDDVS